MASPRPTDQDQRLELGTGGKKEILHVRKKGGVPPSARDIGGGGREGRRGGEAWRFPETGTGQHMNQTQIAAMAAAAAIQQQIQQRQAQQQQLLQRMGALGASAAGLTMGMTGLAAPVPAEVAAPVQFVTDVDINHSSQKHILTRGAFTDEVTRRTGAAVTCRGVFRKIGADAPTKDPCLHLHVVADTEDSMNRAEEMIKSKMGEAPLPAHAYSALVHLGCHVPFGFDAVAEIEGPAKQYTTHIMTETGTQLLVVGAGAPQHSNVTDSLAVYIGSTDIDKLQSATALVANLMSAVRTKSEACVADYVQQQQQQQQLAFQPTFTQPVYSQQMGTGGFKPRPPPPPPVPGPNHAPSAVLAHQMGMQALQVRRPK